MTSEKNDEEWVTVRVPRSVHTDLAELLHEIQRGGFGVFGAKLEAIGEEMLVTAASKKVSRGLVIGLGLKSLRERIQKAKP